MSNKHPEKAAQTVVSEVGLAALVYLAKNGGVLLVFLPPNHKMGCWLFPVVVPKKKNVVAFLKPKPQKPEVSF